MRRLPPQLLAGSFCSRPSPAPLGVRRLSASVLHGLGCLDRRLFDAYREQVFGGARRGAGAATDTSGAAGKAAALPGARAKRAGVRRRRHRARADPLRHAALGCMRSRAAPGYTGTIANAAIGRRGVGRHYGVGAGGERAGDHTASWCGARARPPNPCARVRACARPDARAPRRAWTCAAHCAVRDLAERLPKKSPRLAQKKRAAALSQAGVRATAPDASVATLKQLARSGPSRP